jgi:hypothetical protein
MYLIPLPIYQSIADNLIRVNINVSLPYTSCQYASIDTINPDGIVYNKGMLIYLSVYLVISLTISKLISITNTTIYLSIYQSIYRCN